VDLQAEDLHDLLNKIHGREVSLPDGGVRLNTVNADIRMLEMWWGERLLALLANPNLAILLLIFGFYGIMFELYSPGWGVAGTLGIICLVLGFLAMAILPINYVGLVLILVALALFVAEVFVTSFGALTLGGVVCLVLGGVMLVDSPIGFVGISLKVLIPVALGTAVITFFLVGSIVKVHRGRVQTGSEGMVGKEAVAQETFVLEGERYTGMVRVHGELWKAVSAAPITDGQVLEIQESKGLTLRVRVPDQGSTNVTEKPMEIHGTH